MLRNVNVTTTAKLRKVFWDNPYQHTLQTKVAAVRENNIVEFESSIVYAFSGGQESDEATVNNIPVLKAELDKKEPSRIYYTLPEQHGLQEGDSVTMKINWERRYRLMRLHFTAEIMLEIVSNQFKIVGNEIKKEKPDNEKELIVKTGAHIKETESRIDFATSIKFSTEVLIEILKEYNKIIAADLPIKKDFYAGETNKRYWKIDGFAQVPCGGTHVASTGEVGYVTLKTESSGTAKKPQQRIRMQLIDDGTEHYKQQREMGIAFYSAQNNVQKSKDNKVEHLVDEQVAIGFKTTCK